MATAIPNNGIILTQLEFTKIVKKDKLRSKTGPFKSTAKKLKFLIESAINAKYSVSSDSVKWNSSYSEYKRLERSFTALEKIWKYNQSKGFEFSTDVSSEIFASNEYFPNLFPSVEVQVRAGYIKRYLENSE